MFCTQCGTEMKEPARFCSHCGAATNPAFASSPYQMPNNRLSRPREDAKIAGVCAGFARYLSVDVVLVRILFLFTLVWGGLGALLYLICWIVMPRDPEFRLTESRPAPVQS